MKLKVFTFGFSESSDGFNDAPLQEFIAGREVIEFSEHFFIHEKTPCLTVIISYREISHDEKGKLILKAMTKSDLAGIRGIGEAKTAAYGDDILRTLAEHLGADSPKSQEQGEEPEA